ncbi:MAG: DUF308 domain-containing protein [Clostridia bacterium]|nr:DUF308 domain-containing protein [Clostridia bacterium]
MKSFLNNIRKNSILALGGFVLAGILLILFPHKIANLAGYVAGALALAFGVTKAINYFSKASVKRVTVFGLTIGILSAIAGIYIITKPYVVSDFIVSTFGVIILVDGILKMKNAIELKKSGMSKFVPILITSLIGILLGIVFILNPGLTLGTMLRIIGGVLVFIGISNLITFFGITKEYKTIINENGEIEGDAKVVSSEDEE